MDPSSACKTCDGAPNLSLNLKTAQRRPSFSKLNTNTMTDSKRAMSAKYNKDHHIVQKDYYRHMKSDAHVTKHNEK